MSEAVMVYEGDQRAEPADPDFERRMLESVGELIVFHGGEWTEEDYEALPEGVRAELHDGRLILSPSPEPAHNFAERKLAERLAELAGDDLVLQEVDVRMAGGLRYRTPDVFVLREWHPKRPIPPEKLLLIAEIVSGNGYVEHGEKNMVYSEAGIEWYLIVEPTQDGYCGTLFHLEDGTYAVAAKADGGAVLRLPEPFDGDLDLARLSHPQSGAR